MTQPARVIVTGRSPDAATGFTMVMAEVDGGAAGHFMVANSIVGTDAELDEIRAQSARRMEAADQTQAGVS